MPSGSDSGEHEDLPSDWETEDAVPSRDSDASEEDLEEEDFAEDEDFIFDPLHLGMDAFQVGYSPRRLRIDSLLHSFIH